MAKLGVLNGGADSPGLNAAIRAITLRAVRHHKMEVVGVMRGWRGLMDGLFAPLTERDVEGVISRGGTLLRISRTNPYRHPHGVESLLENFKRIGLDALIVVGGAETLSVAARLWQENKVPIIGVPKTIDNDVAGTDYSFGFDTTVNIATEAIDRIHTTAESHDRVMVVEVMGHHAGWIALYSGLAGGADLVLVPEHPVSIDKVCETIAGIHERGRDFSIVVVAEGACVTTEKAPDGMVTHASNARDEFDEVRMGGVGVQLGREIEARTGYETRVTILGHTQRGGSPSAFDRVLATRFGVAAVDLAHKKKFGRLVAIHGNRIVDVDLAENAAEPRNVPREMYDAAHALFG